MPMRRLSALLSAAALAAGGYGGAYAGSLAAPELKELVRSLAGPGANCLEDSGGMMVSCASGNRIGQVAVYVVQGQPDIVRVDLKMAADAAMGTMIRTMGSLRDISAKLGLVGDAYQQCSDIGTELKVVGFPLADYNVECRTYARYMTLNAELLFTRR